MKKQNDTNKKNKKHGRSSNWLRLLQRIIMILELLIRLQMVVYGSEPSSSIMPPEVDQIQTTDDSMCR